MQPYEAVQFWMRHKMARKVSEYCALLYKTTQPAPYGTGCVMKTLSCCLREAIFLLPPTPGTKTDQRHKPTYRQTTCMTSANRLAKTWRSKCSTT